MNTTIAKANSYGNVDVRNGTPKGYVHVRGERLQPLCRKLKIKFAQALVDFGGKKNYGFHPIYDGVVVSSRSAPKLQQALADREARANSPAALARKERAQQRQEAKKQERVDRCHRIGIDPGGRTAEWLQRGQIDTDHAELIGFIAEYRHEHTDYDQRLSQCALPGEEAKMYARTTKEADVLPENTWPVYLAHYGFHSPIAKALAGVLQDPKKSHPVWFKEAEIAVRRAGLALDTLNFEKISDAIQCWRDERSE